MVAGIAAIMTIGVYGLVAGIVKLDDGGLYLSRSGSAPLRAFGRGILTAAPWLMKFLSVAGTAAMFLVGGGILTHGIAPLHDAIGHLTETVTQSAGTVAGVLLPFVADALTGIVAGALTLAVVLGVRKLRGPQAA